MPASRIAFAAYPRARVLGATLALFAGVLFLGAMAALSAALVVCSL